MSVLQGSVYVAELVADSDLSGATVSCTITAPDLSITTVSTTAGTVTVSGTVASTPVNASLVGTYLLVWSTSGTVVGSQQDQFSCKAPVADLMSLPDIKDELNIRATDTSYDTRLRRWLSGANFVVENFTGPIRPYPQTDFFDGGTTAIVLMARWVSAITGVTENWSGTDYTLTEQPVGASVNSYGYTWDRDSNTLVRRLTGGQPTIFFPGVRNVSVSYTGGLTVIPENIELAVIEFMKHQYKKSRQDRASTYGGGQNNPDDTIMVGNWSVPNAMVEYLEPLSRPPGIF
jgi:hypothetical protein